MKYYKQLTFTDKINLRLKLNLLCYILRNRKFYCRIKCSVQYMPGHPAYVRSTGSSGKRGQLQLPVETILLNLFVRRRIRARQSGNGPW